MSSVHISQDQDAEEEAVPQRRMVRALTQKYDMNVLRAVQKFEDEFTETLAGFYECEEDDVANQLNMLDIYNADDDASRRILVVSGRFCSSNDVYED